MNRTILILLVVLLSSFCFSQEDNKIRLNLGLSATPALRVFQGNSYLGTDLNIGIVVKTNSGKFIINGAYRFSGGNIFSFILKRSLLGGTMEYHFTSQKKSNFFIGISGFSEIASNYREGLIREGDFIPVSKETLIEHYNKSHFLYHDYWYYYVTTPFEGNLNLGVNFKLSKNFNLSLALGYEVNIINTNYGLWDPNQPNKIIQGKNETEFNHMPAFQFGLKYEISFHKKEKLQPE